MIRELRSEKNKRHLGRFAALLDGASLMVEVGSWIGESACIFAPRVKRLVCVDPWEDYLGEKGEEVFQSFLENTNKWKCIEHLRVKSVQAAMLFQDGTIDAIYIDGVHNYQSVKADILAWKPKLKNGGILAGHDYGPHAPGVIDAVNELLGTPAEIYGETTWRAK